MRVDQERRQADFVAATPLLAEPPDVVAHLIA